VIDAAETALFLAKLPSSEQKFIVVDAATYSAWRQIPRFSEFQTAGDAGLRAIVDGTIGKVKDFFVFRSQFVPKTGSAPATTHNIAFAKDPSGWWSAGFPQPLPGTGAIAEYAELGNFGMRVVMSYQPNTLAQQFTVDVLLWLRRAAERVGRAGQYLGSDRGCATGYCRRAPSCGSGLEALSARQQRRKLTSGPQGSCAPQKKRRDESRRGRHECPRHVAMGTDWAKVKTAKNQGTE